MGEISKSSGKSRGLENLKPFVKGQSGNPKGLPKGQRNYATIYAEAMRMLAEKNGTTTEILEAEMIANAAVLARKGDYRFYKDMLDRLHGSATQSVEISNKDAKKLFGDEEKNKSQKAIGEYIADHSK